MSVRGDNRRDNSEARAALHRDIIIAAGVMLRTSNRRGAKAFPEDSIVDPRLIATRTKGKWHRAGLSLAVAAMERMIELDPKLSKLRAAQTVARIITNYWRRALTDTYREDGSIILEVEPTAEILDKLGAAGLTESLRRAYQRRVKVRA